VGRIDLVRVGLTLRERMPATRKHALRSDLAARCCWHANCTRRIAVIRVGHFPAPTALCNS
jgi:hypothetical protein